MSIPIKTNGNASIKILKKMVFKLSKEELRLFSAEMLSKSSDKKLINRMKRSQKFNAYLEKERRSTNTSLKCNDYVLIQGML